MPFANFLRFIQTSRPWLLVAMLVGGGVAFEAMAQVQLQLTPFGRNQRQEGIPCLEGTGRTGGSGLF